VGVEQERLPFEINLVGPIATENAQRVKIKKKSVKKCCKDRCQIFVPSSVTRLGDFWGLQNNFY